MTVKILGSNSATPAYGRHPTSQLVNIKEQLFLVDCGEAAQIQMQRYHVKRSRINHIFISHLHGDHYFGLIGFLNSLALYGRKNAMHIYCPEGLSEIIQVQLLYELPFPMLFHYLKFDVAECLYDSNSVKIDSFPVHHTIDTWGFLFTEKQRKRVLLPEEVRHFEIPKYYYNQLTQGEDYVRKNGEIVKNEWVTKPGKKPLKYAYTADTAPHTKYFDHISNVDLLYHEATYEEQHKSKAVDRLHSTAMQAAQVACDAKVKQLIIGHFSSRYKVLDDLLLEAQSVFPNTALALEGTEFEI